MFCLHANCPFIDLKTMVGIFFPFCSQDGHRWPKAMQVCVCERERERECVCVCVCCKSVSPRNPLHFTGVGGKLVAALGDDTGGLNSRQSFEWTHDPVESLGILQTVFALLQRP